MFGMRLFLKLLGLSIAAAALGFVLNVSANFLNPTYVPTVVRWGWFVTLCVFIGCAANQAGIQRKIAVSWIQTASRLLWILCAVFIAVIFLGAIHWSVNALWDKIGIRKESAENKAPSNITKPDREVAPA